MTHYTLQRDGKTFSGYKLNDCDEKKCVFRVSGGQAARAAVRLLGIVTPIKDYFFDNPYGSHIYNVCDDPNDPYLGVTND